MKICVLNGSPKGKNSITMQSVEYLAQRFPQHDFQIIHICPQIKRVESDSDSLRKIVSQVGSADGVLWAFPVFHLLVHSHYKRFIELVMDSEVSGTFRGKYAAVLTTSVHWFDNCAHNYVNAICDDLGMKYTGFFSADMDDFLKAPERDRLVLFAGNFFDAIENHAPTAVHFGALNPRRFEYRPGDVTSSIDAGEKKIVIVADCAEDQTNLFRMIGRFGALFSGEIEVVNLREADIKGGCLSCLQCGHENRCAYEGKDEFIDLFESRVLPADILLFAGAIKDRYLSSRWKMFFERMFYHRTNSPALTGKQLGFLISGPLSQIPNLRQVLAGFAEWQGAHLVDLITDEYGTSADIDALLSSLAARLIRYAETGYARPQTFLGVGGMKVFRDNAWGRKRFVFQADHRFYSKHGLYDFPHRDYGVRLKNAAMYPLLKSRRIRKRVYSRLNRLMLKPYREILENNTIKR